MCGRRKKRNVTGNESGKVSKERTWEKKNKQNWGKKRNAESLTFQRLFYTRPSSLLKGAQSFRQGAEQLGALRSTNPCKWLGKRPKRHCRRKKRNKGKMHVPWSPNNKRGKNTEKEKHGKRNRNSERNESRRERESVREKEWNGGNDTEKKKERKADDLRFECLNMCAHWNPLGSLVTEERGDWVNRNGLITRRLPVAFLVHAVCTAQPKKKRKIQDLHL
jgi:hypothetical protein